MVLLRAKSAGWNVSKKKSILTFLSVKSNFIAFGGSEQVVYVLAKVSAGEVLCFHIYIPEQVYILL